MEYLQHILHYYTLMTKMWLLSSYFIRPIKHEFIVIMMRGFILHKILEFYICLRSRPVTPNVVRQLVSQLVS